MRKAIVVLVVLVILALSIEGFAFQNEPDGFRGLKWKDPLPTEEMEYYKESLGMAGYVRLDDKMAIGNVVFYRIVYTFYKNQFFGVVLFFDGEKNYDLMLIICEERYGKASEEKFYEIAWLGQKAYILLKYDFGDKDGFLLMHSTPLLLVKMEEDRKKETEKAEGDW